MQSVAKTKLNHMIVYNITASVDWAIHDEWLGWMQQVYIPAVLNTGNFNAYRIMRLLEIDDSQGPTYAIQFNTPEIAKYNTFIADHASSLQQKSFSIWGDQFVSFNTVMQVLH